MAATKKMTVLLGGLALLLVLAAGYQLYSAGRPQLQITKLASAGGGRYAIRGADFQPGETVSLEIKNAPLGPPSGWHLATLTAGDGQFAFTTEDFRCVRVDDAQLRRQYNRQRVIFVATGLTSGRAASATETAAGILVCE